jgi:kelch-like protein 20/kelch-like protein 24/35
LEYYWKADDYGMKDLQKTIVRYINWHFIEVVALDEWLELPGQKIATLVCNDVLNIEKEEDVYEAIWKWFKNDEKK